ncbi:MAG TPA: hypothetical protein H9814_00570 [Candidatus Bacteroides merdigallinarum]|uniref:Lipoprotein n=1 Tax=Candidatus Bacteroides merdigallinarum TaxID=2838473 RepID=A0A9D2J022_9BACE|nr:hypothetical protein [Candidatus Bacteroides merdigallinarum]
MDKKLRHTTLAATLLLFAACENDELPQPAPQPGGSAIAFTVDAKVAATRSLPENPQTDPDATSPAVQHVSAVRLYIFRHGDDGKTYYAECEEIDKDEWTGLHIADGEDKETVTKTYTLSTTLYPFTDYTLLGVGYEAVKDKKDNDDYSNAYQEIIQLNGTNTDLSTIKDKDVLPTDDQTEIEPGAEVDLSAIVTTLRADKDKGKTHIQHNEYFTGTVRATTDANGFLPEGTTVEMRRRVAGLSACFRLTGFPVEPKGVAVMLWKAQNKDVPTIRKIWQEPFFTDHGNTPLESNNTNNSIEDDPQCLLWLDEFDTEAIKQNARKAPDTDPDDEDDPDTDDPGDLNQADETIIYTTKAEGNSTYLLPQQQSTYVLPQEAPTGNAGKNYTLAVVVYTEEKGNYKAICTKRAALNIGTGGQAELIFATDLGTGIVDDESYYRYPIVANRFYCFGTTDTPLEVEFDPSNPFEVEVEDGWEGQPDLDFRD